MKTAKLLMFVAAASLGLNALAAAPKEKPKAPEKTAEDLPHVSESKEPMPPPAPDAATAKDEAPAVDTAKAKAEPKAETKTAEEAPNKYMKLAEKAVAGDGSANSQLMKAVDEGDLDANEALELALNAKLSRALQPKVEKGDLDAMQKLIKVAKKGDPSARKALDKAYDVLAAKSASGDKKSGLALEYAAQEGENTQMYLDMATKAKEKSAKDEPVMETPDKDKNGKDAVPPEF
jgi:hypothetical protein